MPQVLGWRDSQLTSELPVADRARSVAILDGEVFYEADEWLEGLNDETRSSVEFDRQVRIPTALDFRVGA